MNKLLRFGTCVLAIGLLTACQDTESSQPTLDAIPDEVLDKIESLGFDSNEVKLFDGTLIIEGDITIKLSELDRITMGHELATVEHYSTDNLVSGTPRTISVFVNMPQQYRDATDIAIARYNAENIDLTFQRVTSSSGADIVIRASPWWYGFFGILGSAGFPTAGGDPFNQILLTRSFYDGISNINGLATTIAHEMGHCIGFRHTDYMDRSFSCGGAPDNEGDGGVGANFIPGTPTGPEANSWMLACGSPEGDRPFTSNDVIALETLY